MKTSSSIDYARLSPEDDQPNLQLINSGIKTLFLCLFCCHERELPFSFGGGQVYEKIFLNFKFYLRILFPCISLYPSPFPIPLWFFQIQTLFQSCYLTWNLALLEAGCPRVGSQERRRGMGFVSCIGGWVLSPPLVGFSERGKY